MRRFTKTVIAEGEQVLFIVSPCPVCDKGHWLTAVTCRSAESWSSVESEHFQDGNPETTLEELATEERAARVLRAERVGSSTTRPLSETRH